MPELHPSPVIRLPQLVLAEDLESTLPLEHTDVNAQVTGPVASVAVAQRFGNPFGEPAELEYLVPLPDNAAVTGFELRIGARRIDGEVRERAAAQEAYEDARSQGKRAGLFEQRRPNLFAVRLANVLPGETIHAAVRYQQRLKFEDDSYEFVFPMGLTPRYDSPEHPEEAEGANPPVARGGEPVGPVEISLAVDAGMAVGEPASPSHPIETARVDARRFQVRLAGQQIPDRDFVLRYPLAGEQAQAAGWTSRAGQEQGFLATLAPPRMEGEPDVPAREFVFVLDRSGSMTGEPIAQARNALRACLRVLNPGDTFRILLFDNTLEWYRPEPAALTQAELERADAYLSQVQGRGGTEIVRALEAVLALEADRQRTRYVVFLTDGAVSAEARALEQVRGRIGAARLFTFGVGPSVNRALLSRMAALGRGRAAFLQLDEDIEGAIIRFQDSVAFPVLTDLALEWQNGKAWDVYPERLPDLFYGEPLEICGRVAGDGSAPLRLAVRGRSGETPVELALELPVPAGQDGSIARVWARARVEHLLEQQALEPRRAGPIRDEIIRLALENNLVTPYTSFVALDHETAQGGGKPRLVRVAQPLPQGLSPVGFGPAGAGVNQLAMASGLPFAPPQSPSPAGVLRAMAARLGPEQAVARPRGKIAETQPVPIEISGREAALRWLARSQRADGSWEESVEWTAAALLAFVLAGHTTRAGSFRQPLRRAARWLADHPGSGFAAFARALALEALAAATGDARERELARQARQALPEPAGPVEQAASGAWVEPPQAIHSLDDLRLAAVLNARLKVEDALLQGKDGELVRVWAAALPEG
jgi:Ca-activated chloride channel family protein